jgi:hypothetical protein
MLEQTRANSIKPFHVFHRPLLLIAAESYSFQTIVAFYTSKLFIYQSKNRDLSGSKQSFRFAYQLFSFDQILNLLFLVASHNLASIPVHNLLLS